MLTEEGVNPPSTSPSGQRPDADRLAGKTRMDTLSLTALGIPCRTKAVLSDGREWCYSIQSGSARINVIGVTSYLHGLIFRVTTLTGSGPTTGLKIYVLVAVRVIAIDTRKEPKSQTK